MINAIGSQQSLMLKNNATLSKYNELRSKRNDSSDPNFTGTFGFLKKTHNKTGGLSTMFLGIGGLGATTFLKFNPDLIQDTLSAFIGLFGVVGLFGLGSFIYAATKAAWTPKDGHH